MMKKWFGYLRNKYLLATALYVVYSLFLDDHDIFTIVGNNVKLSETEMTRAQLTVDLDNIHTTLEKLKSKDEVEKYARENKFFKKDDEDIFVIFYED